VTERHITRNVAGVGANTFASFYWGRGCFVCFC